MPSKYTRRKFTLRPELDERLKELAKQHHGDNVSQLLRCAIADHERTLNGKDEYAIRSLEAEIASVSDEIEELKQMVGSGSSDHVDQRIKTSDDAETGRASDDRDSYAVQRCVQSCLMDQGPLTLEGLSSRTDEDVLALREAIEALVERGYVAKVSQDEETHYRIDE